MIHQGDCLDILKQFKGNSVDSLVTDPPAGISFMGKEWDDDKGGRDQWIQWMSTVMKECLRVMKPGAHGLVWALPRTSHWTATALEDAGFEVRDVVNHVFGQGFPKSLNISKAIDKMKGAEREVIGSHIKAGSITSGKMHAGSNEVGVITEILHTVPSTHEAKQWDGWGSALKPACEHWILVRKPLEEKTIAENVLEWGCGGLNIGASMIGFQSEEDLDQTKVPMPNFVGSNNNLKRTSRSEEIFNPNPQGRFPANFILSHNDDCELLGEKKVQGTKWGKQKTKHDGDKSMFGLSVPDSVNNFSGTETVSDWDCTDGCAVAELDRQSGVLTTGTHSSKYIRRARENISKGFEKERIMENRPSNSGGASRFFYVAKASKRDKGEMNGHPTVKSTKLMSYLITLITPPQGIVLDPFMGSGSTGVAALRKGFQFIGIEKEEEDFKIAEARMKSITIQQELICA